MSGYSYRPERTLHLQRSAPVTDKAAFELGRYLVFLAIIAILSFFFGFIAMQSWNAVLPMLLHLAVISYWQAYSLTFIATALGWIGWLLVARKRAAK